MNEERFKVIDDDFSKWIVDTTLKEDKHEGAIYTAYDMCRKLNELWEENRQLRTQLFICQQSKNDDGRFQVWEVPPIPKGTRITVSTTEMRGLDE